MFSRISSQTPDLLPNLESLKKICKATSVLDAIFSQQWESRCNTFNSKWAADEEFFEMRNGSGDSLMVLFQNKGCVINGFSHDFTQPDKQILAKDLPVCFHEFIFGEPVQSIGTTFLLWKSDELNWKSGPNNDNDDSELMLKILDGNPQTFHDWATDYFDKEIPFQFVAEIYEGKNLTKSIIKQIVDIEDWQLLESDLNEIGFPFDFS